MITRTKEKIVGVLFLLATLTFMIGSALIDSSLIQSDYLAHMYTNRMEVFMGLFLELINSASVIGIAILLFPFVKHYSPPIALGYLSSRLIESVLLIVGMISPLILIALSADYISIGGDASYNQLGNILIRGQEMTFELAMFVLGIGSLMFCYLMYHKRLIPRLLSLLGIVGYIALIVSSCLVITGYDPGIYLFIPGGIFEIIFPLWLIFKGFNTR